ncbi:hypothetical protein WJX77_001353 [Trebouxia sp. C0004]
MRSPGVVCVASVIACLTLAHCQRLTEKPIALLPAAEPGLQGVHEPRHISGYFQLNRTYDAHMFYFFFESRSLKPDAPVVLWMTGGPGCSSELAVFYENGPYHINPDLSLERSEYGWDTNSNMIFVDQPINTGFSYSDDPRDRVFSEHTVAEDMLDFLQAFLEVHPEMADRDFFVTGESYAGHYVPAVSNRLFLEMNKPDVEKKINLKGFAIGNGLTDPGIQYGAYSDFALINNLISPTAARWIKATFPLCRIGIQLCNSWDVSLVCQLSLQYCQTTQFAPIMAANPTMNVYDIRKECEGPLCYDFSLLEKYINQDSVRQKLGVGDRKWEECSTSVYFDMLGDWMKNFDPPIPAMLQAGVRVMIYAGAEDFICNWVGNQRWVDSLPWHGKGQWAATTEQQWMVDGESAGTAKAVGPLSFVKVDAAGHMVPMDVPMHALDMITKFTRNQSLVETKDVTFRPTVDFAAKSLGRKSGSVDVS